MCISNTNITNNNKVYLLRVSDIKTCRHYQTLRIFHHDELMQVLKMRYQSRKENIGKNMGYSKQLKKQFAGLNTLSGTELQQRRDKLSKAGYSLNISKSGFTTTVRAKQRMYSSSKIPRDIL